MIPAGKAIMGNLNKNANNSMHDQT